MEFLQGVEPPPDRLRYEVSLPFAKHRFAIRANDRYLAIQVRGDFAAGLCAINRPSHSISTYHGEMRSSIPVRSHPVFVPLKSTDPPFLQLEEVRNAILALRLEVDESLAFYGNGISAYIRPRADRHLTDVLTSLAKLASALPPYVTEPLAFTDLPAQFPSANPTDQKVGHC